MFTTVQTVSRAFQTLFTSFERNSKGSSVYRDAQSQAAGAGVVVAAHSTAGHGGQGPADVFAGVEGAMPGPPASGCAAAPNLESSGESESQ